MFRQNECDQQQKCHSFCSPSIVAKYQPVFFADISFPNNCNAKVQQQSVGIDKMLLNIIVSKQRPKIFMFTQLSHLPITDCMSLTRNIWCWLPSTTSFRSRKNLKSTCSVARQRFLSQTSIFWTMPAMILKHSIMLSTNSRWNEKKLNTLKMVSVLWLYVKNKPPPAHHMLNVNCDMGAEVS